ncbi:MAG: sulfotransferase [Chthoniobacteraceae bacterium]
MPVDFITVVSGLPRSGTSLMMQMLQAGGMPVVADGVRAADADNPRGYLELEAVKQLKADAAWLSTARGHAVKVISMLLYELPSTHSYRVIFMERDMAEILASQREMLIRRGASASDADDAQMRRHMKNHLEKMDAWLGARPNFQVLHCRYGDLLCAPAEQIRRIRDFLGVALDEAAMARAIDPALHRNRIATGSQRGGAKAPK